MKLEYFLLPFRLILRFTLKLSPYCVMCVHKVAVELTKKAKLLLTRAVASRSTASKVLAEVKVVSLLVLASFLISTYALTI